MSVLTTLLATATLVSCLISVWQVSKRRAAQCTAQQALAAAADSQSRFEAFMAHSPFSAYIKDDQGRLVYANRKTIDLFEPILGKLIGRHPTELWPPEIAAKIISEDLKVFRENQSSETVSLIPMGRDMSTWLTVKFPFRLEGRTFLGGLSINITERDRAKEALQVSEERFRTAFEHATIGMCVADATGRFVEVNRGFCRITGYSAEELLLLDFPAITHPDDREKSNLKWRAACDRGDPDVHLEKRYIRKNGTAVWVRISVGIVRNLRNERTHSIAIVEDLTKEKEADEVALVSEQRWQLALQAATDGIWDWDMRANTAFLSSRSKEMLGYKDEELHNSPEMWKFLIHPDDYDYAVDAVAAHLEKRTPDYRTELRMLCRDGGYKWVLARGKAIWDASGNPLRLIGTHTDISERKGAEEHLLYQAMHDPLTGLVNRRFFTSRLADEIEKARADGEPLCLCVCDLDRFKVINDREGHQAGDDVLVMFANILRDGIRTGDLAGRMGGDEFYVLLPRTTGPDAVTCIERVRDRLQTVAFGGNAGKMFVVTASFGVAELGSCKEAAQLIEAADRALYGAKELGRNTVHAC